ncbi:unnamed protein product [Euphydryas editha]|uniref:N-acyl-aliphatic-L-amino acid amidohydrolase n=1 Tax=Euphydryas editha TaxID=104508 RepID=A0AAU9VC96_EUPED|nr:unnamed protein product [Euphydryas editha]
MFFITFYILSSVSVMLCDNISNEYNREQYEQNPAVKILQKYIQIDTSDLKNLELSTDFWKRQADELGLSFAVYRPRGLPICVMTLNGKRPELPSIMLNSHADVVPTNTGKWTYPPFSGHIDENGYLHGRGAQDTKDVGVQYIEAIRKLIRNNVTLDRTVHITVMPDEETGGSRGMLPFVETEDFKSLNIGFAFDEGYPSRNDAMYVSYQDKRPWQAKYTIRGNGGHSSIVKNGNVIEGLQRLINNIMEFRKEQVQIMTTKDANDFGAYTSVNINMIEGGVAPNVIPKEIVAVVDMRLSVTADVNNVENMFNSWLNELGYNSTVEYLRRVEYSPATAVDNSNPYWIAMQETMMELGITVDAIVCPAASDLIAIRSKGIPALGFTTKRNVLSKAHDINEYIDLNTFIKGIDVYVALLKKICNLPDFSK